jgi:predicted nucleic-acid-binding protein
VIALDTNVLVRFLVEDDEAQSAKAAKLLKRETAKGGRCFLANIVIVETVWVLHRSYRLRRPEIVDVVRRLLASGHLHFESHDLVAQALDAYAEGGGDFADYLIRANSEHAGCSGMATFDTALLKERFFQKLT